MQYRLSPGLALFSLGSMSIVIIASTTTLFNFQLQGDEVHFWATSQWLFENGAPSLEKLRSYNELSTPFPFLVFGSIDHWLHGGIAAARAVSAIASLGTAVLIASSFGTSKRSLLSLTGLFLFPYFLYVSVLAYTDSMAAAFAVLGVCCGLKQQRVLGALFFTVGIACRQYIVAFPVAMFACCCLSAFRQSRPLPSDYKWHLVAIASLIFWYWFFGGPGPALAIQSQSIVAGRLYPDHVAYFLTTIGAYYVVLEAGLFRELLIRPIALRVMTLLALIACFIWFPPMTNVNTVTDTMGYLDKSVRLLNSDQLRVSIFFILGAAACLRFDPLSLAGLILYSNAALMLVAHVAWDKYALPCLAVLWLLKGNGSNDIDNYPFICSTLRSPHPPPA